MRLTALAAKGLPGRYPAVAPATGASVPSPIEGWDAVSPIAAMSPKRAVKLINWFPQPDWVEVRKGFVTHSNTQTGMPVETLAAYQGSVSAKLFAASDDSIFDVTSGNPSAASVTGLGNVRFQYVNFATTGGNFLYMVNGADAPQYYDGTSWDVASISDISPESIIGVNSHKNRLWFTLENSSDAAYLPVDSIQGAAVLFPLGGLWSKGGYLMAMGTWSIDGGTGLDDYAVFVSSRGQCAIFSGIDPDNDFSLVGVFDMGAPIGRRCFTRVGADLALICVDGVVPLSKAMIERAAVIAVSLTARIQRVMTQSARDYSDNFGWQLLAYPRGTRAILNVPIVENGEQEQYVMNTLTGAWCRFTGMNANCWELLNDKLYFGGNSGVVYEADKGGTDVGSIMRADMMTAFNYFNQRGIQKRWTMCRPLLTTDLSVSPGIAFNVDFQEDAGIFVPTSTQNPQALWDVAEWDDAVWAGEVVTRGAWTSVSGIGYCSSIRMVADFPHPHEGEQALWGEGLWGIGRWGELDGAEVTLRVNGFDLTMARGSFI